MVPADDPFMARNEARWRAGCWSTCPRAPARGAAPADGLRRRPGDEARVAGPDRARGGRRGRGLGALRGRREGEGLFNGVVELVGRRRRQAPLRLRAGALGAKAGCSRPSAPSSAATPTSSGWRSGSARPAGRCGWRPSSPGAGHRRRVTGAYAGDGRPASRLRHHAGARRRAHHLRPRVPGRARRPGDGRLARDDPRRPGRPAAPTPFRRAATCCSPSRAHADAIPGLEIEADDVRCTHAAAVAQVDPEQLYYLRRAACPRRRPSAWSSTASCRSCRAHAGGPRPGPAVRRARQPARRDPRLAARPSGRRSPAADGDPGDIDVRRGNDQRKVARLRRLELAGHRLAGWARSRRCPGRAPEGARLVRDDPQANVVPFSVLEDRRPARGRAPPITRTVATGGCGLLGATRMGLAPATLPAPLLGGPEIDGASTVCSL